MTALYDRTDYGAVIRDMKRRIRQLETANPFAGASITRGSGLRLGMPAAIYLDGAGTIVAGGLTCSLANGGQLGAGSAFIRGSGGGQVGAGGTMIGGDGNISHSSGTNRFNGGVNVTGGVSGASASFAGPVGAGSVYSIGEVNAGGVYSRGDISTEKKMFIGATDVGFAIGAARYVADQAYALANGGASQSQLDALSQAMANLASTLAAVIGRVNEHQQWWEQAGKPSRPPLTQG